MVKLVGNTIITTDILLAEHDREIRAKAIDGFAYRMISMMPGHKQDILKIAEQLKGDAE